MADRLLLVAALLFLPACQTSGPEPSRGIRAVPPETVRRLSVRSDASAPALQPLHLLGQSDRADAEALDAPQAWIELEDVLTSVDRHFPVILGALEELEIAAAEVLKAEGGFDTKLRSGADLERGFYDTETFDVGIEQPLAPLGASVFGGYRRGTGNFAIYDGKRKTNDGGELNFGVKLSLLQGRRIDPRRVELWRARLGRAQADPELLQKKLKATLEAAKAYWSWVGAGRLREVALRLLALAEGRRGQIERGVEEGLLAEINLTENQRLIVDRRAKLLKAERDLQAAAIRLSLYWRDAEGAPSVPPDSVLPYEFPAPRDPEAVLGERDVEFALERRPEPLALEIQLESLRVQGDLASNNLLPKLDFKLAASQDLGDAVSNPDDKGEFELQALVQFDVPLQRRKARGDLRGIDAKVAKLERTLQFQRDLVVSEVLDSASALRQSWLSIEQAEENVRLANELANAERSLLRAGESDLLRVNLREQQAAVAAGGLVSVLEKYFAVLAEYRAVLGVGHEDGPAVVLESSP